MIGLVVEIANHGNDAIIVLGGEVDDQETTLRESHPPYTLSIEEEHILAQELIILERDGRPVAAIVSLAEYEAFRAWQEVHFARETPSPGEILSLATQVYEGLSPDDVDEIERLALDRSHFFVRQE